ncbi:MAG: hypothetical protein ACREKL_09595 [Chthoniobacterales bacterium]
MKRWFPLVVLCVTCAAIAHGATVQEVYAAGVRASIAGDEVTARKLFMQVLAADPENKAAAANLRRMDLAASTKGTLKSRVEALTIPKVDFKDASLSAVLDYLPKLAAKQPGGAAINIVQMFPKEYGEEKKITLQLTNVPMSSLLDYVAELGGVKVTYDKAAVVIKMPDAVKPQATQ